MLEVQIRHCESKDVEAITELYAQHHAYADTLQLPFPSRAMWQQRLTQPEPGFHFLAAELDGKLVGQITLKVEQSQRRKHVANFGMGVREEFQGKGIGSQMLAAIIDLAENWLNIQRLELTVYTDNEAAIALYKKHGFIIEGESANYAFKNGSFVDVYHMTRLK